MWEQIVLLHLIPAVVKMLPLVTPETAERALQQLQEAVARRKAAVAENEALDAPQDDR